MALEGGRAERLADFERVTEAPLLVLALVLIPLLVLPLVVELPGGVEHGIVALDWTIWAIFALDLVTRTYLSGSRLTYLAKHWYDVLLVALPFLRPLRVFRSARLLRVLRLTRLAAVFTRVFEVGRRILARRGLQWVLLGGFLCVFFCAGAAYFFERDGSGSINSVGSAIWWAFSTITTVGYGDTYPVTPEGRGVGILLMLFGITFFSWIVANVSAFLIEQSRSEPTQEQLVTLEQVMAKLESLEKELKITRGGNGSEPSPKSGNREEDFANDVRF